MSISWILAAIHLLPLAVGLSAVWARGRALSGSLTAQSLQRAFFADNFWGLVAVVWIVAALMLSACGQVASADSGSPEVRHGEAVFAQNGCVGCHALTTEVRVGPGLKGVMAGGGPNGEALTEANVAAWIREGAAASGSAMPAYLALSEAEMQALIVYLQTLQ